MTRVTASLILPGVGWKPRGRSSAAGEAPSWRCLYASATMGLSMNRFSHHAPGYAGPTLRVALQDGLQVESVVIRHGASTARRVAGERRPTLCVSSQVACKLGCAVCATGVGTSGASAASGSAQTGRASDSAYAPWLCRGRYLQHLHIGQSILIETQKL